MHHFYILTGPTAILLHIFLKRARWRDQHGAASGGWEQIDKLTKTATLKLTNPTLLIVPTAVTSTIM